MELGEKEESSESKSFKSDTDQKRDTPRWEKKLKLWKKYQGDEHNMYTTSFMWWPKTRSTKYYCLGNCYINAK